MRDLFVTDDVCMRKTVLEMVVHGAAEDDDVVAREIDVDVGNATGGNIMVNDCCGVDDWCVSDSISKAKGDGAVYRGAEEESRCRSRDYGQRRWCRRRFW